MSAATSFHITPAQRQFIAQRKSALLRMEEAARRFQAEKEQARREASERDLAARKQALIEWEIERRRIDDMRAKANERIAAVRKVQETPKRARWSMISTSRFNEALARVSRAYDIQPNEIIGYSRSRHVATARAHLAVILCIEAEHVSIKSVGRAMGMDHTSILNHLATYNAFFGTNVRGVKPRHSCTKQFVEVHPPHLEEPGPLLAIMEGRAPFGEAA